MYFYTNGIERALLYYQKQHPCSIQLAWSNIICITHYYNTEFHLSQATTFIMHQKKPSTYPHKTALMSLQTATLLNSCIRNATEYLRVLKRCIWSRMENNNCIPVNVSASLQVSRSSVAREKEKPTSGKQIFSQDLFIVFQIGIYFAQKGRENINCINSRLHLQFTT